MDKLTTTQSRMTYARICVEIKADMPPPTSIKYIDEDGTDCTQEVHYEWIPKLCLKCKTFGHSCENKEDPLKLKADSRKEEGFRKQNFQQINQQKGAQPEKAYYSNRDRHIRMNEVKEVGIEGKKNDHPTDDGERVMPLTQEQLEIMKNIEYDALGQSTHAPPEAEQGKSPNKFLVLADMEDNDMLTENQQQLQQNNFTPTKKPQVNSLVSSESEPEDDLGKNKGALKESSSTDDDSIDTSTPLELIIRSKTKPPKQSPTQVESYASQVQLDKLEGNESDSHVSKNEEVDSSGIQQRDSSINTYAEDSPYVENIIVEREPPQTRRGTSKGRSRGRGYKVNK